MKRIPFAATLVAALLCMGPAGPAALDAPEGIAKGPEARGAGADMRADVRLDDILDTLTGKEAKEEPKKETQGDSKKETKKETKEEAEKRAKEERRRQLLEGIGTMLSATGEVDYASERTIGESLALEGFARYGMPVKDKKLQRYVNLVGMAVARNSLRPNIPYRFVVVESPLQNAFSCPGGIIFVSSALIGAMQNEAQLACVLAHEVAHVGHKHALKSIQRARFFQGVGKVTAATLEGEKGQQFEDMIGDLQTVLFDKGLDREMEFQADLTGMETAYRTGYDPHGMVAVLEILRKLESGSDKRGSWFSTHPPLSLRIEKCRARLTGLKGWENMARVEDRFTRRADETSP